MGKGRSGVLSRIAAPRNNDRVCDFIGRCLKDGVGVWMLYVLYFVLCSLKLPLQIRVGFKLRITILPPESFGGTVAITIVSAALVKAVSTAQTKSGF